jgi:CDP-diacylglycerol---serine O-phosphatidyltransferase
MRRVGQLKTVYLLPNFLTSVCLMCGAYAITMTLQQSYVYASLSIMVAGLFDGLDGRLARLTKSESDFGVEYDSLADLISFGVAPAILMYSWALSPFGRVGLMVTFLYIICAALRLARFNVQISKVEKSSFQGLPVPAAASYVVTLIIFYDHAFAAVPDKNALILLGMLTVAILMVSTVRYPSFKGIDFKSRRSFYYLVGLIAFIFVIALKPEVSLFVTSLVYLSYGLLRSVLSYLHKSEEGKSRPSGGMNKSASVKLLQINKTDGADHEK